MYILRVDDTGGLIACIVFVLAFIMPYVKNDFIQIVWGLGLGALCLYYTGTFLMYIFSLIIGLF